MYFTQYATQYDTTQWSRTINENGNIIPFIFYYTEVANIKCYDFKAFSGLLHSAVIRFKDIKHIDDTPTFPE